MVERKQNTGDGEIPVRGAGSLAKLRQEMNRLLDRFGGSRSHRRGHHSGSGLVAGPLREWDPLAALEWPSLADADVDFGRADLSETDEGYELQVDLPGMNKDDIRVDLSDGILTVSGERSDEREDERKGYYLSERSYGSVQRSFRVPDSVKSEDIKARFSDGVLTLGMPRTEEAKKNQRSIEVE